MFLSEIINSLIENQQTYYHATYQPVMSSIMQQGLGGSNAQANWDGSKPGVTYLANDPHVAISYAETNDEVPDDWLDQIVVLAIDGNSLDPNYLKDDTNVLDDDSTKEYHKTIPPTAFKVV